MVWTKFMDMHSGGGRKLDWEYIFIEAPEEEAKIIFQNRFNRNPNRVTCTCCGSDYSIDESPTLEQSTAFYRHCQYAYFDKNNNRSTEDKAWKSGIGLVDGSYGKYVEEQDERLIRTRKNCNTEPENKWGLYQTMEELLKTKVFNDGENVLIITAAEITPNQRRGELHREGYVWED